ncbi:DNA primase phage-associated [Paramagnetospirillum magnetotacticum MS-1]|uniref:DNA primase phage-associated n=1 Tax=Paramagnetospirillum magnetotacticum MS-1 TaxID=272627 RepID=A0A0C2YVU7_PARME|nr:replicative helicase RepA [Paramagnetospirillum magnetotacticum]KIL98835.1 DNA primase phage-associated [Paramagnetospirillum magnetotacticum MS-1]
MTPRDTVAAFPATSQQSAIRATPFVWIEPANIPPRKWLYGHHLIRGYVSLTVAPGATGKSSLLIADALAMSANRNLVGTPVYAGRPLRVWIWNLEDPIDELQRRITATAIQYQIHSTDIEGRLFVDSGRDQSLCIARQGHNGIEILDPVIDALQAEILAREIDVLIVDPFVSSHQVSENDNGAIDAVAKKWGAIADRTGCAIELVHHLRKLPHGIEATAESARGAVSLVAAARSVRVLNRMAKEEALQCGLTSNKGHFKVSDDKNNLAAATDSENWFRMESVQLDNGDNVGVVVQWDKPDPFDGITPRHLLAVQKAIDGKDYRQNVQATDWVGQHIGHIVGLDPAKPHDKNRLKSLIKTWINNGALIADEIMNKKGRPTPVIAVGKWVTAAEVAATNVADDEFPLG